VDRIQHLVSRFNGPAMRGRVHYVTFAENSNSDISTLKALAVDRGAAGLDAGNLVRCQRRRDQRIECRKAESTIAARGPLAHRQDAAAGSIKKKTSVRKNTDQ
jgi:hypothetical protein